MRLRAGPFAIVAGTLFVLLVAGNLPTPLYGVYRERFGFSGTTLTLIFAVYTIALIPSLLAFGQLSDRVGSRPVIAGGLAVGALGLLLLALAQSTTMLLVARAVQGIALGTAVGTIPAALVELEPSGDNSRAAMATVLGQSGGSAGGPLLAGVLAQWAPAPRQLCYLVGFVLTLAAMAGVLAIREPHRPSGSWRLQKPSVPAEIREPFARAGLTGAAVWAVGALFLSVVPSYAADLLDTDNLARLGAISAAMLTAACLVQVVAVRGAIIPVHAQPLGLALLIAGLAALVTAFPLHALPLVLAAAVLAGAGLGLGYFGAQAEINRLAPADRRGEVTAAFITCMYTAVSISAISTGLLSDAFSLETAVAITGIAIAVIASATIVWHLARLTATRPDAPRPGHRRPEEHRRAA
jgi:MFS family permease